MCFQMEPFNRHGEKLSFCKTAAFRARFENLQRFEESGRSGVKADSDSRISRWHFEFKTDKKENNSDKPNGRPTQALIQTRAM